MSNHISEVIFSTPHGSHLYGLNHERSDLDIFYVTSNMRDSKVHHFVSGNLDQTIVGLRHFLELAQSGSHQSVEALFSQQKTWASNREARAWRPYLGALRIQGAEVSQKYERTIKRFCYGDLKKRRHAVRLSLNLEQLRDQGRFNPELDPIEISYVNLLARNEGDKLARLLGVK